MNLKIKGWAEMPISLLSTEQQEKIVQSLSYVSPYENEDGTRKTINQYKITDTSICVPPEWLRTHYPTVFEMASNETVCTGELIHSRLPNPNHASVKDPEAQAKFMSDLEESARTYHNVLAYAMTGSGKTVVSLTVAAKLGYRTLVLVHSNQLKLQWLKEISEKLGVEEDQVGIIQQDKCEYEGKSVVVGMLHTFAARNYPDEVYNAFGTIIIDECHKISTEHFSEVLPRFNAKYRIGLTATPRRKDGSDVVLYNFLGPIRVVSKTTVMPIKVYVKNYYSKRKLWGADQGQRIQCLTKDPDRNDLIIHYLKALYVGKRNILVVSHSIQHLEHLMFMAKKEGIPFEDIGQFTAQRTVKDNNGKIIGKRDVSAKDLEHAKTRRIMFCTYGMIKEAIDIPRLDAGIDATPDWKATQLLGRIRRYKEGKLYPKWITLRDMKCDISQNMWYSRAQEYRECGAEFITI